MKLCNILRRCDVQLILIMMLTLSGRGGAKVYAEISSSFSTERNSLAAYSLVALASSSFSFSASASALSSPSSPQSVWSDSWHQQEKSPMYYLAQASSDEKRRTSSTAKRKSSVANTSARSPRSAARSEQRSSQGRAILRSEKKFKMGGSAKSTVIDFDDTDITGERRDPGVGFVQSTFAERKSNFVKIRREWHDAMIKSTQFVD